jgi:hypothetical protein
MPKPINPDNTRAIRWTVRKYRAGDEDALFDLARAVNGDTIAKDDWLKLWDWKYRRNPAGQPFIRLAEDNGKIVGQYILNPVFINYRGQAVRGAQSVDTMTHPGYRRQTIFETLAKKVYEDAAQAGVALLIGFPNALSLPGFTGKLDWLDVSAYHVRIMPLNPAAAMRSFTANKFLQLPGTAALSRLGKVVFRASPPPPIPGLKLTRISSFDGRIDDLCLQAEKDAVISVKRNRDYLNWRYSAVPGTEYRIYLAELQEQILGYIVFRSQKLQGTIVGRIYDLIVPQQHEGIAHQLVAKAIADFKQEKAACILYRYIAGGHMAQTLRRCGFFSLPFLGEKVRFISRALAPEIRAEELKNKKNWFIQTGDSDAL